MNFRSLYFSYLIFEPLNVQNQMFELCTFSQIWSQLLLLVIHTRVIFYINPVNPVNPGVQLFEIKIKTKTLANYNVRLMVTFTI